MQEPFSIHLSLGGSSGLVNGGYLGHWPSLCAMLAAVGMQVVLIDGISLEVQFPPLQGVSQEVNLIPYVSHQPTHSGSKTLDKTSGEVGKGRGYLVEMFN